MRCTARLLGGSCNLNVFSTCCLKVCNTIVRLRLCVCEYVKLICDVRSGCWYHKAAASVAAAPIVAACITSIVGSPAPKSMLQIALIPQRK